MPDDSTLCKKLQLDSLKKLDGWELNTDRKSKISVSKNLFIIFYILLEDSFYNYFNTTLKLQKAY